jgi:hypothetical protein
MAIQKVGRPSTQLDPQTKKPRPLSYHMIKTDIDGWVDANKYLPGDYDLVQMKMGRKIVSGWLSGLTWDGLHYKPETKVEFWRRKIEYDEESIL